VGLKAHETVFYFAIINPIRDHNYLYMQYLHLKQRRTTPEHNIGIPHLCSNIFACALGVSDQTPNTKLTVINQHNV
jgi:hypothetical protein